MSARFALPIPVEPSAPPPSGSCDLIRRPPPPETSSASGDDRDLLATSEATDEAVHDGSPSFADGAGGHPPFVFSAKFSVSCP